MLRLGILTKPLFEGRENDRAGTSKKVNICAILRYIATQSFFDVSCVVARVSERRLVEIYVQEMVKIIGPYRRFPCNDGIFDTEYFSSFSQS